MTNEIKEAKEELNKRIQRRNNFIQKYNETGRKFYQTMVEMENKDITEMTNAIIKAEANL